VLLEGTVHLTESKRPTWAQAEGSPLPLGVTWIEEEQAFNFALHAEDAESVTLMRSVSIFCATNQVGYGTAAFR
jgi:hypothetical protein